VNCLLRLASNQDPPDFILLIARIKA
jgi:hypothetical protein